MFMLWDILGVVESVWLSVFGIGNVMIVVFEVFIVVVVLVVRFWIGF